MENISIDVRVDTHLKTLGVSPKRRRKIVGAVMSDPKTARSAAFEILSCKIKAQLEEVLCFIIVPPARYVVVENTPGYLPDSDPIPCTTMADAIRQARVMTKELRQEYGYRISRDDSRTWRAELGGNDLGRVIQILDIEKEPAENAQES